MLEAKLANSQKKIEMLKEKETNKNDTLSDIQVSQIKHIEENYA